VREIKILDQLDQCFHALIQIYQTPRLICGYVACAVARLVQEWAGDNFGHDGIIVNSLEEVTSLLSQLRKPEVLVPRVEEVMEFVFLARQKYVSEHAADFAPTQLRSYMTDWVANYEIGDYLVAHPELAAAHFIRNIERGDDVEHEEKARLVEEEPFRHLHVFAQSPDRMRTPSEWVAWMQQGGGRAASMIVDTLGHFVVAVPLRVTTEGKDTQSVTLVLNSLGGCYVNAPAVEAAHRMAHLGQSDSNSSFFLAGARA